MTLGVAGATTALLLWMSAAGVAHTTKPAINKGAGDLALRGYDAVAYFVTGTAVKGSGQFEYRWRGAVWRFASPANRVRFVNEPERYAPQFGGYCAWAISRDYIADADPEAWRIVGGRLYLIYSNAVLRRWEQDIDGNIAKARANWPAVLDR